MTTSEEIKAEYTSSLADLTCNSRPLINVLTMLAEENLQNASVIVEAIETHLAKVNTEVKLPILYLIDCIVKNVGETYTTLFGQNIVSTFCNVFKVVDEKTRSEMFKLRQTWNELFPQMKLYAIDVQINFLDPAWPVTAAPPSNSIHLNPKFLKNSSKAVKTSQQNTAQLDSMSTLREEFLQKQKELLELEKKKLQLEVLESQVQLYKNAAVVPPIGKPTNILLKPEVAKQLVPPNSSSIKLKPGNTTNSAVRTGRINPVNSALVSAAKPNRDPRLLRQQQAKSSSANKNNSTASNNVASNNNVQLGTKTSTLDSNKIVTNKMSVRSNNNSSSSSGEPPRLINNKDEKSPKSYQKSSSRHDKSSLSNRSSRKSATTSNGSENSSSSSSKPPSNSKIQSPTKRSSSKSSPTSSRHKKNRDVDITSSKKHGKRDSSSTVSKLVKNSETVFKGVKSSSLKNRNYVRRNLSVSPLPSLDDQLPVQDEDLRSFGTPEKLARLQHDVKSEPISAPPTTATTTLSEQTTDGGPSNQTVVDVDLRQLPNAAAVNKKRTSTEKIDSVPAKKSKTEVFDVLFGNEDTDLRQLPVVTNERPPTPPPPIISSSNDEKITTISDSPKRNSNLDAIRAKLANATTNQKDHDQSFGNISLQPISDEELEEDYSDDERSGSKPFDDRGFGQHSDKFMMRRGGNNWRGNRRRQWEGTGRGGNNINNNNNNNNNNNQRRPWINQKPWRTNFNDEVTTKSPEISQDITVVGCVNQDDIKTINIDGVPRDIRYYDETAVIFMNWDDPREISFQDGIRPVKFNDNESYLLAFNQPATDCLVDGVMRKVKLGAPSREIYIDGNPYECYFGGPTITIDLNGRKTAVKLDGPAPQVKIGTVKRTDLVAGKVNLIVNAKLIVPVFLDGRLQKFIVDGETVTLKFVDALKTVLINDVPFNVEFGGLPKPITIHNKKHFIRFSVLPKGCRPGHVCIKGMEEGPMVVEGSSRAVGDEDNSQEKTDASVIDSNEPALPVVGTKQLRHDSPDRNNSNSPLFFQNLLQQNSLNNLDALMTPSVTGANSSYGGYQVEVQNTDSQSSSNLPETSSHQTNFALPTTININELLQKLVATGIVSTSTDKMEPKPEPVSKQSIKKNPLDNLKPILFTKPETLKIRQSALYTALYSGMQCSSCGMRFPPEQSMHYSQHLDWHFRQNRKGKKNIRVAASRRWYYSISDWKNYEEIEDLEEREKNYFDQQLTQAEGTGEDAEEEVEIPSVPADSDVTDSRCEVCQDKFDQFFNEEKEEWHLKNAIRIDDKTYHPLCYEDYQVSLQDQSADDNKLESNQEEEKQDDGIIPGLEIILDDDEEEENGEDKDKDGDDVEVVIDDESNSKNDKASVEDGSNGAEEYEDEDDDVIINEVAPVKIVVDDDDDDYYDGRDNVQVPQEVRHERMEIDDGFVDVSEGLINLKNGGQIKIKSEPLDDSDDLKDDDDQPLDKSREDEDDGKNSFVDLDQPPIIQHHTPALVSSIDGNVEMDAGVPTSSSGIGGKIKINISKPLPVITPKESNSTSNNSESCSNIGGDSSSSSLIEPIVDPSQPLPPGEEPVQLNLKPALQGVDLKKLPAVRKGTELSGLCSIM